MPTSQDDSPPLPDDRSGTTSPGSLHGLQLIAPSEDSLKAAFGGFPSGVAAICAMVDGEPQGFVVSSFSSGVSFDPPLVLFSVMNSSATWPVLRDAPQLGVSVLASSHHLIGRQLASKSGNRFQDVPVVETDDGALFVAGAPVSFECSVVSEIPAGDHLVVLLQITRLASNTGSEPLIYHAARFRTLSL